MKKLLLSTFASVILGACSAPSSQAPQGDVLPSAKPAPSAPMSDVKQEPTEIDCGAPGAPVVCVSLSHMDEAYKHLKALGAEISIDRLSTGYGKKLKSGADAPNGGAVNSELDAALVGLPPTNATVLQPAVQAVKDCIAVLTSKEKRSDEQFDGQRDQCTLRAGRLIGEAKIELRVAGAVLSPDFKNLHWGEDVSSVRRAMGKRAANEDGSSLFYEETLGSHAAILLLSFVDGQLAGAMYSFNDKHANDNVYLDDFSQMDQLLAEKYGKPYYSDKEWSDSLYKDNPSRFGMALATGRMRQLSAWTLDATSIRHVVSGDNFEIHHLIVYRSREFAWAQQQAANKNVAKGL